MKLKSHSVPLFHQVAQKVLKNAKLACSRLGQYRMPFAWAARYFVFLNQEDALFMKPVCACNRWKLFGFIYRYKKTNPKLFITYCSFMFFFTGSAVPINTHTRAHTHQQSSNDKLTSRDLGYTLRETCMPSFFNSALLLPGLCSKMHQGHWTKVPASLPSTDRTATSCPMMTCSNCWLTSES